MADVPAHHAGDEHRNVRLFTLSFDHSLLVTGILTTALACQGCSGWRRFMGMSGVEEASGASWITRLGNNAAQGWFRGLLPLRQQGALLRKGYLLASTDTFPEGLPPSTMVKGSFNQDQPV